MSGLERFEVLGPLRAWRGATAIDLGPLQQRVVFAVLLLHANRPIGRQKMITAIWGEDPPAYAVNLVQRHISGLRRVLEPAQDGLARASSNRLVWTDAGYLLTLPAGRLDLEMFDRDLARARAARVAGDQVGAAEMLRSALALWRGPTCDGLTSPFLDAQRDQLAERRINALEERIELELGLGTRVDLIDELRGLIAEYPLRERLRGLLMLALYRAGCQADALVAYQDARRCLRDELGVEPAAPLQRLHQQILTADPTLTATATGRDISIGINAEISRGPQPAQLPHGLSDFVGRDAEIDRLNALLPGSGWDNGPAVAITVIAGTAGVGKTALAVCWAHQVAGRFPDGQLYVNLRGFDPAGPPMLPAEAVRGFLDAFEVPVERIPVGLEAQSSLYRSILAGRRVLVVLDNARDAAQVRPLLPGAPGCVVVVTSRVWLTSLIAAEGAWPLTVGLLSVAESRELLSRRLGPGRVVAEPDSVAQIITLCAQLPLALSIVAAQAAMHPGFSLATLVKELHETRDGLQAFEGGEVGYDVRGVFSWSYQRLDSGQARLFRLLALHSGPDITAAAAASLAGVDLAQARRILAELTRCHLIDQQIPGRFGFHDLLRAYATELVDAHDSRDEQDAARQRMLDHYLLSAHAAKRLLHPRWDPITLTTPLTGVAPETVADRTAALAWFQAEYAVLLAVIQLAAATRHHTHAWQLASTLSEFFRLRWYWADCAAIENSALRAAQRYDDRQGQAYAHCSLGRALAWLGRLDEAHDHLRQAIDLFAEFDDPVGRAESYFGLANVFALQGNLADALAYFQRAHDLFHAAGSRHGMARALGNIGSIHALLGEPQQTLGYCQQSRTLNQQVGDRRLEADALGLLGYAHHLLGQHHQAIDYLQQSIALNRELGAHNIATTLNCLGDAHHAAGDRDAARNAWQQALDNLDQLSTIPPASGLGSADADKIHAKLHSLDAPDRRSRPMQ